MVHHPGEAAPLLPDQRILGHKRPIQIDRAPAQGEAAHAEGWRASDACRVEGHDETAHPGRTRRPRRAGVDERGRRVHRPGDRRLLSAQPPAAWYRLGDRAQRRGIRARAGLGEGDGDRAFTPDQRCQVLLPHRFRTTCKLRSDQANLHWRGREVHVSFRQGLRRKPEEDRILHARPAVLLGKPDAKHAHGSQPALDVPGEFGLAGPLAVTRPQHIVSELSEAAAEVLLRFCEREGDQLDPTWRIASTNILSSSPRCLGTMAPSALRISSRRSRIYSALRSRSVIPRVTEVSTAETWPPPTERT